MTTPVKKPYDIEVELRKRRQERNARTILTPLRALIATSFDAAVKAAKKKAKRT